MVMGQMDVRVQVDVSGDMPPLARVGAHLNLKPLRRRSAGLVGGPMKTIPTA